MRAFYQQCFDFEIAGAEDYCVLESVSSIEHVRAVAAGLGGEVDPAETEWDFRGLRHCDGVDPVGNVMQLLEALE